jgi:hypothetical protein
VVIAPTRLTAQSQVCDRVCVATGLNANGRQQSSGAGAAGAWREGAGGGGASSRTFQFELWRPVTISRAPGFLSG